MPARSRLWPDPRVKPPYGAAELDRGHPLAQALSIHWGMNEGGGALVQDPVRAQHGVLSGTTKPGWRASGVGLGLEFDGSTGYVVNQSVLNTTRVTLAVQFRVLTLPGATSPRKICGFTNGPAASANGWSPSAPAPTPNVVEWKVFDSADRIATNPSALSANETYLFVGTADGTTSRLYQNGVQTASIAAGATYAGYSVPNVFAGGSTSAIGFLHQTIDWVGVWTEALPANHVLWLTKDPYAMYRPLVLRRYSLPAGANIPQKMHHYERLR